MRQLLLCLAFLIIVTIIFIFIHTRKFVVFNNMMEHITNIERSNISADVSSIEEYKVVYSRWHKSPGNFTGVKTILYWNRMYAEQHRHFMFGVGDIFKKCKIPHCYGTPDRNLFDSLDQFDAVLFHGIEMNLTDLPLIRSTEQRYIFFSWESPVSRPINAIQFMIRSNFYNWTMSYRLDSDIRRPYGQVIDTLTKNIVAPPQLPHGIVPWRSPEQSLYVPSEQEMLIIRGKTQMAAWFVSHCDTNSQREILTFRLQRYFKVDIYGKCGGLKCDQANIYSEECYDLVEKDYFFYLSFENTLCEDYVTEKLFYLLQRYVIPIVYGGAKYEKFAPPHSYINVNDFKTVKELADYLISLSKNPKEYASYFWWKKFYEIQDTTKSTLCDLCEKLHDTKMPEKSLENFNQYYVQNQCHSPKLPSFKND